MKKLHPSTVAVIENHKQILLIRISYFLKYRCLGVIVLVGNYPWWELSRSSCTLQRSIVQSVIICGQLSRGIYPGGDCPVILCTRPIVQGRIFPPPFKNMG